MHRILKTIHMPYIVNKRQLSITCSLGIATYPSDGEDAETLVKHADMAMYKAKAEGKNRYAFFSEDLRVSANHEMELITSLQFALKHNELQLYYQRRWIAPLEKLWASRPSSAGTIPSSA